MRTLTSTLTARQQAKSYIAVCQAVLTKGATSYTYDLTRIKDLDHTEQPYQQKAEIILDNSDGTLTSLDLKGYQLVLSYGMRTPAGEEYSSTAPLYVVGQMLNSQEGSLGCVLAAIGLSDILAEDKANNSYIPASTDTKTVKTLIGEIMAATLACYSHCPAYEVVWDSEDSLIDTYQPKDSFRIYIGGSRMAAVRRLLDYTKCVGRFEDDGKYHIMSPTTTGTTYDYEYTLEGGHVFFAKAYRKVLVIPNYVVVQSRDDDSPQYTGYYSDTDSIASFREVREYIQTRLASDAQATAIATAVVSKYQMQANMGSADVPMNCGAELFDYVKVTDSRENDYRVGNIGSIRRYWRKGIFRMSFSFGGWLSVKGLLSDLEVNSDVGSSIIRTTSSGLDVVLDDIQDGSVYAKLKSVHLTGGTLKMDDQVYYSAGYNPTEKEIQVHRGTTAPADTTKLWLDTTTSPSQWKRYSGGAWVVCTPKDLDDLPNGTTYSRVKTASLNASGLVLLDQVVAGTYGLVLTADISAGHIKLDSVEDGTTYKKVLATQISAGKINLTSECTYGVGYDPSNKRRVFTSTPTTPYDVGDLWFGSNNVYRCSTARATGAFNGADWTTITLDVITDGSAYSRIRNTCISSGYIELNQYTAVDGEWYDESGVAIDAASGINIYGKNNALTTRATKAGTIQCYVGSDGAIYAGAGAVKISAGGIDINAFSKPLNFNVGGSTLAQIRTSGATLYLKCGQIYFEDCDYLLSPSGMAFYPPASNTAKLGVTGYEWAEIHGEKFYLGDGTYLYMDGGALKHSTLGTVAFV